MKKLTHEQIERIIDENFGFANVKEAMLFMQAEVLRINGWQPIETAPKDGTPVLAIAAGNHPHTGNPYTASVVEIDGDHVHLHCDSEEDSWASLKEWKLSHWMPLPAAPPRATGCPDTMDDTARFAADELPAILRKQAS